MKNYNFFLRVKTFSVLLILFLAANTYSQNSLNSIEKYKQAGLVWGLLKYHHPEISSGRYEWDNAFVTLCEKLEPIKNQSEMNDLLMNFVESYKTNKLKEKTADSDNGLFINNKDYSWIDKDVFGPELFDALLKIRNNKNISNYYASTDIISKVLLFKNEKGFNNFDYTVKSHRLLLLYSFWNAMGYWNVNKYLTEEKWLSILDYMTSDFIGCITQFDFEMAKHKMISKLNDSHAEYGSRVVSDSILKYKPYFKVKNVNDSLVVNSIFNNEKAIKDNLALGDIITKIDGKSISVCINERLSTLISSSNPNHLKQFSHVMLYNTIDSINVEIIKQNGIKINKFIHLNKNQTADQASSLERHKKDKWFFVKPSIAYINLDKITSKDLKDVFNQISNTEGLILDLRNYPKSFRVNDLLKYICRKRKDFVKVLSPLENKPFLGTFNNFGLVSKLIANPSKTGRNNSEYYKGKIILLVNRITQSRAEYIGMAIQQSPNCFTIGEQTAGAVMNVVGYEMSDKTKINFTGLGAFYPNGEGTQRRGLHIDYYVKESAKSYDPELYIKEAVKIIENK